MHVHMFYHDINDDVMLIVEFTRRVPMLSTNRSLANK